jgi:hypothetical protein
MEIRSLIILAAKADSEGNFRVADRLTAKIETMSREARFDYRRLGPLTAQLFNGLVGNAQSARSATHTKQFGKKFFTPEDYKKIKDSYDAEKAAKAALKNNAGGQNISGGGPNAQAQAGSPSLPGGQNITGGGPNAQAQIVQYLNPPTPGKTGRAGRKGKDGAQGLQGLKGDTGPQGPAGKWWPGVVAGLLSGAIGAGGVAAWLASKGADSASIRDIENHLGRLPQYQMMTRRTESGDLTGAKAIQAQNFVDTNSTNPRLKNQRDWYNFALQESGGDKNFANNVISLVKATPQMPSSIGGGPNI